MTITLRVDKGSPLTIAELDGNFTDLDGRLIVVEDGQAVVKSIDEIVQVGNSLVVQYTDSSEDGPFTFNVTMTYRGDWEPSTIYAQNDMVHANGVIYIVLLAHTSDLVFDPGASAGTAGDYYAPFLAMPELQIPDGGDTGYVLSKVSSDDYDYQWINRGIPDGGAIGDVLTKTTSEDLDYAWVTPETPEVPALDDLSDVDISTSPATGDVLIFDGSTWVNEAISSAIVVQNTSATTIGPVLADASKYFRCTSATDITVTIPLNATVAFPTGTTLKFRQCSTGTVVLVGEGAVVLNSIDGYLTETAQEGAVIEAIKIGTNEWDVFGLLAADVSA